MNAKARELYKAIRSDTIPEPEKEERVKLAVALWKACAEKHHPECQWQLGLRYAEGQVTDQRDPHKQACYWWRKAAANGLKKAEEKLVEEADKTDSPLKDPCYKQSIILHGLKAHDLAYSAISFQKRGSKNS